ncbi:putative NADH dehydrogenase [Apostichopus japonicus]|uniref:NADH dehydrogenase [ubiquinone] 1 beta subcomplex subunit 3 n=1 Tax=Stichopus japonicus TaxID=307972 RepID=A0A2G8L0N8_STIJA|nr:putative NADH dehydrogenase [Apostichopus japonicus]
MGKTGKLPYHIPDWKTWKVEDVPELMSLKQRLAAKGLKDPWIRNEVWRFQPGMGKMPWYKLVFKGFGLGAGAFIIAVGLEKLFWKDDDHGH